MARTARRRTDRLETARRAQATTRAPPLARHSDEREPRLLGRVAVGVGWPRRHEADFESLEPRALLRVEERMWSCRDREIAVSEAATKDVLELQALGLVHGHYLHRVGPSGRCLGIVGCAREN